MSILELPGRRSRTWLVGATLFVVLMLTVPHFIVTNEDVYKLAVATAHQKTQFNNTLGIPVREAWFSEGITEIGRGAKAELLIPVKGSRRNGNLRVAAVKDKSSWRLRELTLEVTHPDEHIDLLSDGGS